MLYDDLNYLIGCINQKMEQHGVRLGDTLILLVLELTKIEILNDNKISDHTLKALNEVTARMSRFYYQLDHPELFREIQERLAPPRFAPYNENVYSADIGVVGIAAKDWSLFFSGAVRHLYQNVNKSAF